MRLLISVIFILTILSPSEAFKLHGGIQAMLSEKGLRYITGLAEEGLPQIFDGLKIPDQEGSGYAIKNLRLFDVAPPNVKAHFDGEDNGIASNATIPSIKVFGEYTAGWGFLSTSGNMSAEITDLSFASTLKFLIGIGGVPVINITTCSANVRKTDLEFQTNDLVGGAISSFKSVIESFLVSSIDWIICSSAQTAVMAYADSMINPPGGVVPTVPPGEAFILCEDLPPPGPGAAAATDAQGTNMGGLVPLPLKNMNLNMSMTEIPTITNNDFQMGFNGSFVYRTYNSRISWVEKDQIRAPHNRRMLRMVVSDMVANSFFEHVFVHQLGVLNEQCDREFESRHKLNINTIPLRSKTLEKICSSCRGDIAAELIRPPQLTTTKQRGVWLDMNGWVRLKVTVFRKKVDLFWVDANVQVSVRPFVRDQKLKANVQIERINIESDNRAGKLGRVMGFFIKHSSNLASEVIPDSVIPKLEKKLNNALGSGVPLPKVCGLKFHNTIAYPADAGVIIDTDIEYNARPILKQFKKLLETPVAMPVPTKAA